MENAMTKIGRSVRALAVALTVLCALTGCTQSVDTPADAGPVLEPVSWQYGLSVDCEGGEARWGGLTSDVAYHVVLCGDDGCDALDPRLIEVYADEVVAPCGGYDRALLGERIGG